MLEVDKHLGKTELERTLQMDAVIVGGGVMGLLLAKKLGDLGQSVVLLEVGAAVAAGSSIKNHGWLHRGSAHAVSVRDPEKAKQVVQKLIYGHEFIKSYVPEAVEDPFEPVFTLTVDPETAERAVRVWEDLGVFYEHIPNKVFQEMDRGIKDLPYFIFQSADLRINNRILYRKLLSDIRSRGNYVLTDSYFEYEDEEKIAVHSRGENYSIRSSVFIYCTGNNLAENYQKLTGDKLGMNYWKSHLIVLPKFSPFSIVSMDRDLPIIINHKGTSVVNRAYDEVERNSPDYLVDDQEVESTFQSVLKLYPGIENLRGEVESIACNKPTLVANQARHSVDSQIFEPVSNHFFVLPGKMTEAPYVADELIQRIYSRLDFNEVTERPIDKFGRKELPVALQAVVS